METKAPVGTRLPSGGSIGHLNTLTKSKELIFAHVYFWVHLFCARVPPAVQPGVGVGCHPSLGRGDKVGLISRS